MSRLFALWVDLTLTPPAGAEQFNASSIKYVMDFASRLNNAMEVVPQVDLLRGRILANCFLEPSTRTATSFHVAMLRLGGSVVSLTQENSSVQKGETLEDTVRTLENYADVIALRHPTIGAADLASSVLTNLPLVNAGDGGGEHPTQALLDLFCMHQRFGSLTEPITLTLLGDLKFGRTVHSLAQMVSHFPNIRLNFVSPSNLQMPEYYTDILKKRNCKFEVYEHLDDVLPKTDVLYQTRVQKERFTDLAEYQRSKGLFIIDKTTLTKMKKTSIIMHPFPRVDEIADEVDTDGRAFYFKQPAFGVRVRMALLGLVMGQESKI